MSHSGAARLAAVIGWPVSHSRSPRLHGFWLDAYGVDGAYVPLAVHPDDFKATLRLLPRIGFVGANVTVPHKEAAAALADRLDGTAARIGAVNTLIFTPDGIEGRNTDAHGFLASLMAGQPNWKPGAGPVVLLGAGGAARAIGVALLEAGVPSLRIVNRHLERARTLANHLGAPAEALPWEALPGQLGDAALLVNSTTLGMVGASPLEIDLAPLPLAATVMDIVYTPLETELLRRARARGNPTVDGLGMLLHQAQPAFAAWFGVTPEVTPALRAAVLG